MLKKYIVLEKLVFYLTKFNDKYIYLKRQKDSQLFLCRPPWKSISWLSNGWFNYQLVNQEILIQAYLSEFLVKTHWNFKSIFGIDISPTTFRFLSWLLLCRSPWKIISSDPLDGSTTNWIIRRETLPGISQWVFSQN